MTTAKHSTHGADGQGAPEEARHAPPGQDAKHGHGAEHKHGHGAEEKHPHQAETAEEKHSHQAEASSEEKHAHKKHGAADPAAEAEAKAAQYLELAQRTQADFENFRKRMTRDAGLAEQRGVERLAKELLPALDHFEVALRGAETDGTASADVLKGFHLVHDEFIAALERLGIERFSPKGDPFDPNEHEAVLQQPSESAESGTVIEVYQHGYRLNGTVLRPARVVVAA